MQSNAISVERLGKLYRLRHQPGPRYVALRDVIADGFRTAASRLLRGTNGAASPTSEDFWALKDVSFDIAAGSVVGVIGRNGAGKSTLLKLLSRITEPTVGRIRLNGRIVSLLEVGTGFHPELSGRENIFLNGAILGMSRAEMRRKFDEIVAFAEVEKFLDTPVKRYSSGMYVRLAFAVAAHLEPEILIVDEVLAVGDAEFQKKCLGKMRSVASSDGRTVLMVSHQLGLVRELCDEGLLLRGGRLVTSGPAAEVVDRYLADQAARKDQSIDSKHVVSVTQTDGSSGVFFGEPFEMRIALRDLPPCAIGLNVSLRNSIGHMISLFSTNPHDGVTLPRQSEMVVTFILDPCCLAPGEYSVDLAVTEPAIRHIEDLAGVYHFEVHPRRVGGTWAYESKYGDVFPPHRWQVA